MARLTPSSAHDVAVALADAPRLEDHAREASAGRRRAEEAHQPARGEDDDEGEHGPEDEPPVRDTDMTVSCRKMKTKAPRSGPEEVGEAAEQDHEDDVPECVQYASVGSTLPVGGRGARRPPPRRRRRS